MRKTMSEMQLDFCLDVYSQVQEVLFLRTPFAKDREVIFQLNQRTSSQGGVTCMTRLRRVLKLANTP